MPTVVTSRNVSLPISHELSALASPREPDALQRQYRRANVVNLQGHSDKQAIEQLARTVEKLRRRILGGGANQNATGTFRGEYDAASVYNSYDEVVISTGDNQGTFVCLVDGTTGIAPYTGSPNWIQKPGGLLGRWR